MKSPSDPKYQQDTLVPPVKVIHFLTFPQVHAKSVNEDSYLGTQKPWILFYGWWIFYTLKQHQGSWVMTHVTGGSNLMQMYGVEGFPL